MSTASVVGDWVYFDGGDFSFTQGLAIFDITALQFRDQYTAAAPLYEHLDPVKQFYFQSPQ